MSKYCGNNNAYKRIIKKTVNKVEEPKHVVIPLPETPTESETENVPEELPVEVNDILKKLKKKVKEKTNGGV